MGQGGVFFGAAHHAEYDDRLFHFGFSIALNTFNFTIKSEPDLAKFDSLMIVHTKAIPGFGLGLVTNMRLGKYFDLRLIPSLAFGDRRVLYTFRVDSTHLVVDKKGIESVYLDIPLLLKFKSQRFKNFRFYVTAGAQYSIDLISNKKKHTSRPRELFLDLNRHDVQGQAGVGFDFYFTYFKLTTEFKMSFGVFDLLQHDDHLYAQSIRSLKSKTIQFSLIFE
jgi:hypothetical protein